MITLDMIARSDAAGLRRAIESARSIVDAVQVGIDGRSDAETRQAAHELADTVWEFGRQDLGLSLAEWEADGIDFAAARNLGRIQVKTPWVLVLDTDEYVSVAPPGLRDVLAAAADDEDNISVHVHLGVTKTTDPQRLARARCRWVSATHNQLIIGDSVGDSALTIVQDTSIRPATRQAQRDAQRERAMDAVVDAAVSGADPTVSAAFHAAKHLILRGRMLDQATKLVRWFRSHTEVGGPMAEDRGNIAFLLASAYAEDSNFQESYRWAVRALLDGPHANALLLLGDLEKARGSTTNAHTWYRLAGEAPISQRLEHVDFGKIQRKRLCEVEGQSSCFSPST